MFKKLILVKTAITLLFALYLIIPTLSAQTFTGSFDLVATHYYPNGNERSDTISYYFGKEKTAIIIHAKRRNPDMRMVFNPKDSTITSLFEINGKKGGFILPMDNKHWPGMQYALRPFGSGPRKKLNYTGNKTEIEGYSCRELLAENEEYSAKIMLAEDIKLSMSSVFAYQSVGAGKAQDESGLFDKFGIQELPLELNLKSKEEKAHVIIRLVNFNKSVPDTIFSTEGHSLNKVD